METSRKNLILRLIQDDILNTRLVNGMQELGIDASPYCLHLSDSIFYLLNIKDEARFKKYMSLTKEAAKLDYSQNVKLLEEKARGILGEVGKA